MKREEFKDWLIARGVGPKSASFRVSAVRQVERAMQQLGDPSADLDAAFAVDEFERLRAGLNSLIEDRKRGGSVSNPFPARHKARQHVGWTPQLLNRPGFAGGYLV